MLPLLHPTRCRSTALALLAALCLAACGGGGSSTNPGGAPAETAQAGLTESNYLDYAQPAGHAVLLASDLLMLLRSVALPGIPGSTFKPPLVPPQVRTMNVSGACVWPTSGIQQGTNDREFADRDGNGRYSAGDGLIFRLADCPWYDEQPTATGTIRLTITQADYSDMHELTALEARVEFTDLKIGGDAAVNGTGDIHLSSPTSTTIAARLHLHDAQALLRGDPLVLGLRVAHLLGRDRFEIRSNGGLSVRGLSLLATQPSATAGPYASGPTAGELRLRDVAGNTVAMTDQANSSVVISFTPSGAASPSRTLSARRWAQFRLRTVEVHEVTPAPPPSFDPMTLNQSYVSNYSYASGTLTYVAGLPTPTPPATTASAPEASAPEASTSDPGP